MNFCASAEVSGLNDRVLPRVGAGIAVSIALHGLLLFAYRQGAAPLWRDDATVPRDALVVTLRAPVRQPVPEPIPEPISEPAPEADPDVTPKPEVKAKPALKAEKQTAQKAEAQTANTRPAPAQSHPAPDVIALPESGAAAPDTFTVAPPSGTPQFDPDAARKFAREIATKPDPARAGMAVEQIPPKPYATETKAARVIAQAKRRDCKDGVPGGLLAPIFLALDKKDSGCKW